MRGQFFNTDNERLTKILSQFQLTQGPLFHYTEMKAASAIVRGELWITRADDLSDEEEIQHGIQVFKSVDDSSPVREIIKAAEDRLSHSYVMSLSLNPCNDYLWGKYAPKSGGRLEFGFDFADQFRFASPLFDLYESYEGKVIYGGEQQHEIAELIVAALPEIITDTPHIVDRQLFENAIFQCLLFCKRSMFEREEEVRIVLVRRDPAEQRFEFKNGCSGKRFVKAALNDKLRPKLEILGPWRA